MGKVGQFSANSKTIITDGENEAILKSDGSLKVIESDTSVEPGAEIRLKFNIKGELIFIEKIIGTTLQRKKVTDTNYSGGTNLSDVTRTLIFPKYEVA
jgi:hypothetical protein